MRIARILLVEDKLIWQDILRIHIKRVLPDSDLRVVGTFQEAADELEQGEWDLLVTDLGLPPDSKSVLGMLLVGIAKKVEVPCIVVSETKAVTREHVRDLFSENYKARDYFGKDELQKLPEKQREFQNLIRQIVEVSPDSPRATTLRNVLIGVSKSTIFLRSDGLKGNLPIPEGQLTKLFVFFVENVAVGLPAKVVKNTVLNQAVGCPEDTSANPFLRDAVFDLNAKFRKWAEVSKDQRWIRSGEHGYRLNTSDVKWELTPEAERYLRGGKSVWDLLVDPHDLQEKTANRDQRLPAHPKRRPPADREAEGES